MLLCFPIPFLAAKSLLNIFQLLLVFLLKGQQVYSFHLQDFYNEMKVKSFQVISTAKFM